jgi:hypothetical protein
MGSTHLESIERVTDHDPGTPAYTASQEVAPGQHAVTVTAASCHSYTTGRLSVAAVTGILEKLSLKKLSPVLEM